MAVFSQRRIQWRKLGQNLQRETRGVADGVQDVCSAIAPKLKEDKEEDKNKARVKVFACILFHGNFSFLFIPKEAIEIGL